MGPFQSPELGNSGFLRLVAIMAGLTACAVLTRFPFLYNTGVDEAFYLVVGRQWLEGMTPYAYSFDVKPPLLFALTAGAEFVFGANLFAAKALAMVSVSATACALYVFGRRFLGVSAGVTAALLYIVSSLTLGGTFSPAELTMAPFTAFGMLLGCLAALTQIRPRLWLLLAAGLCLGAAACVKQTALFEALALAAFLFVGRPLTGGLKSVVLLAAGFLVVPLGFAFYFLADGHFAAFFADAVIAAVGRVSVFYLGWNETLTGLLLGLMLMLPVIILAAAAWVFPGGSKSSVLPFVGAWTAGALGGVLATRAALVIYFLPLLPPLCLMAGAFVQHWGTRIPGRKRLVMAAAITAVAAYSAFFTAPLFFAGRDNLASAHEAAAAMRGAGLKSDDRILVADRDLIVYLASGANPPKVVFHPLHLLCGFPLPDNANALADSLKSRPAFIVEANPLYARACEIPERRLLLDGALSRDYCQLGQFRNTLTGAGSGSLVVFGLKERAGARCL